MEIPKPFPPTLIDTSPCRERTQAQTDQPGCERILHWILIYLLPNEWGLFSTLLIIYVLKQTLILKYIYIKLSSSGSHFLCCPIHPLLVFLNKLKIYQKAFWLNGFSWPPHQHHHITYYKYKLIFLFPIFFTIFFLCLSHRINKSFLQKPAMVSLSVESHSVLYFYYMLQSSAIKDMCEHKHKYYKHKTVHNMGTQDECPCFK